MCGNFLSRGQLGLGAALPLVGTGKGARSLEAGSGTQPLPAGVPGRPGQDRAPLPFVVVRIKRQKDQSKYSLEVIDRKILSARKIINRVLSEDGFVLIWH